MSWQVAVWYLNLDPLAEKAPGWTGYRYAFNNPISVIDPNGMEEVYNDGYGTWNAATISTIGMRPTSQKEEEEKMNNTGTNNPKNNGIGLQMNNSNPLAVKFPHLFGKSSNNRQQGQIRPVLVTVTDDIVGRGTVRAYRDGDANTLYEVPLYRVTVTGEDNEGNSVAEDFTAFRFGVQLDARRNVNTPRVVGLADEQSYVLSWNNITTMPGQMAWRVNRGWFIHRRPENALGATWGSIGCVEICGVGGWANFNNTIRSLSGSNDLNAISQARRLTVQYEAAARPPLRRWGN